MISCDVGCLKMDENEVYTKNLHSSRELTINQEILGQPIFGHAFFCTLGLNGRLSGRHQSHEVFTRKSYCCLQKLLRSSLQHGSKFQNDQTIPRFSKDVKPRKKKNAAKSFKNQSTGALQHLTDSSQYIHVYTTYQVNMCNRYYQ